jgi:peptide/nickel transport system permease protein
MPGKRTVSEIVAPPTSRVQISAAIGLVTAIVRWLAGLAMVLIFVSIAVFLATRVLPGDPALIKLGPRASPEALAQLRAEMGTDRGLLPQYITYMSNVLRGDLGETLSGESVSGIIAERAPLTLLLLGCGMTTSVLIAIPLALLSAGRRDRMPDHAIRAIVLIALFLPSFWVAFITIRFIALTTGWFPVSGLGSTPSELARSLVLPSLTIGLATAPLLIRSLRSSLIEILESDYVAVARSLKVGWWRLATRHILRNAAGPTVAMLGVLLGLLLFDVVVIEYAFNIPGLGSALIDGARTRDVFVVQGIAFVFSVAVVVANAAADAVTKLMDPRQRSR